ncbi:MAG: hypothetical protein EXQ85_02795 [Alphaproteobacteria bacterium]|nr:hypothetical protein [Alphaproteobacteria bacterium]
MTEPIGEVAMGVTQQLAEEIAGTRAADVPPVARERIKRLLIDQIGVSYLGYALTGKALAAYARDVGGPPEAVLIGDGSRVSAEMAAAFNAQVCRNTDFEETGPGPHAGPVMAHTALAVGQRIGSSGADVLTAAALGYEINGRFFFARKDGDIRHLGLAAAIVAAHLLRLDPPAINRMLGLAWELPSKSLLFQLPKVPKRVSRLGMGNLWSARFGVQAALMALHGFDGLTDELDYLDREYHLDRLGRSPAPFHYTATQLQLKPWPTSRLCHGALQMLERIMDEERLTAADIDHVVLHLADLYTVPHQTDPAPDECWQVIYSVQWGVTMVAHRVTPGPDWYAPARLADRACRDFAATKVELKADAEASATLRSLDWLALPNGIEVRAKGKAHRGRMAFRDVLGSPGNPMTPAMFEEKFLRLAATVIGAPRAQELLTALNHIESAANVNTIAALL